MAGVDVVRAIHSSHVLKTHSVVLICTRGGREGGGEKEGQILATILNIKILGGGGQLTWQNIDIAVLGLVGIFSGRLEAVRIITIQSQTLK